jgi:hypothetical protein
VEGKLIMKRKNKRKLSNIDETVVFHTPLLSGLKSKLKSFFLNTKRRTVFDDFGIYLTMVISFLLLSFNILDNPQIISMTDFYESFDLRVLFFVILYFSVKILEKRKEERERVLEFPKPIDLFYMGSFSIGLLGFLVIFNSLVLVPIFIGNAGNSLTIEIFSHLRVIATEELVFRGLGIFLITYPLTYFLNKDNGDKKEFLIWITAITIIALIFAFFHYPKYYDPSNFPYFLQYGERVHIALPMLYLFLLGFLLGFARYKYGLTSAILIHFLNNVFANGVIFPLLI